MLRLGLKSCTGGAQERRGSAIRLILKNHGAHTQPRIENSGRFLDGHGIWFEGRNWPATHEADETDSRANEGEAK
jgi:hypothetical protein